MSFFDLSRQLTCSHFVENGISIIDFPVSNFDLEGTLHRTLAERYKIHGDFSLAKIHEALSWDEISGYLQKAGHWYDPLQALGEPMVSEYYKLINWLSYKMGFDFVFEHNPLVRYHIPAKLNDQFRLSGGELFTHHSDTLLGDYFQQINMWLPFCDVKNTSTLSVCSKRTSLKVLEKFSKENDLDYESYKDGRGVFFDYVKSCPEVIDLVRADSMAANLRYGQILTFDPRILHGTAENKENNTRVSMDFRIVPIADYELIVAELEAAGDMPNSYEGDRLIKGEFYNSLSARELF